jgi:cellulose synthase/poly-beta-1,6-N-acetylglucosamine synthase-like glycosyltransferase
MIAWSIVAAVVLPYLAIYYGLTLVMLLFSALETRRLRRIPAPLAAEAARASGELPAVSILVPAHNESAGIVRTVQSLLGVEYPALEVIVIDDGSTDNTVPLLEEAFDLAPAPHQTAGRLTFQRVHRAYASRRDGRLRVVTKRNGGKADALNAGIDAARYSLVLVVDADVVLAADALVHLAIPFVLDDTTAATSGIIRLQNGCTIVDGRLREAAAPRSWLERIQVVEYLRAYSIGRMFFNRVNAHLIISGAFGLFSRRLLLELGGYQPHAVGEDMELVVRLHRRLRDEGRPYRIAFSPDAVCLTEAPHRLRDLGGQRTRWHQGLLSTLRLHRVLCGRSAYGAIGMFAFPYFVAELVLPAIELLGWVMLPVVVLADAVAVPYGWGGGALLVLPGTTVSLLSLAIDAWAFRFYSRPQDEVALVAAAALEPFGYRQATIYFRLRAFVRYYRTLQLRTAWQSPGRLGAAAGNALAGGAESRP